LQRHFSTGQRVSETVFLLSELHRVRVLVSNGRTKASISGVKWFSGAPGFLEKKKKNAEPRTVFSITSGKSPESCYLLLVFYRFFSLGMRNFLIRKINVSGRPLVDDLPSCRSVKRPWLSLNCRQSLYKTCQRRGRASWG
jgi:hypothetical protein